jgi:ABC-2 type transport system permease protein
MNSPSAMTFAQLRLEQKVFWRNRQSAVFSFALPVVFVVLFGLLFQGVNTGGTGGTPYTSYFVAGMIGIALLSATFANLAITLSFQRDQLILKRLRGTPLGAGPILASKVLNAVIVVVIQVVIILTLGKIMYNTPFPKSWPAFVLIIIFGIIVFAMLGIAMTGFIPNADSGPAVVQLPFLTLQFISGVFFPFTTEPAFLKTAANLFPLRWLVDAVRAAYLGVDYFHIRTVRGVHEPKVVTGLHAVTASGTAYLVLTIWLAIAVIVARRRFRWERRTA